MLGAHPRTEAEIRLMEGRFGPYVTDGTTNATLPKSLAPDALTLEEAAQLIDERAARAAGEEGPGPQGAGEEGAGQEEGSEVMIIAGIGCTCCRRAGTATAGARPSAQFRLYISRYLDRLDPPEGWTRTSAGSATAGLGRAKHWRRILATTDTVTIHYVGRFIDGVEFDSSFARDEPATFPLPRLIRAGRRGCR